MEILECTPVAPVTHQYRIQCFIPVSTVGTVNEQRASEAIWILERVVAVIPGMSVLSRLEVVCVGLTRGNWTLRHAVDSISFVCIELTNAMPMDRGSIIGMKIGDMNSLVEV